MKYPEAFEKLIERFESFPGVGPKTAERYAYYIINKAKRDDVDEFVNALMDSVNTIHECEICGMLTDQDICDICEDESRTKQLMIVEDCKSIIAYEKTGIYKGKYHVLKGLISPVNGVGPEDIGLDKIVKRIKDESIEELILATPSNMEGELTSLYIKKILANENIKIYRIGFGLPVETSIEYADEVTLIKSLEGKQQI